MKALLLRSILLLGAAAVLGAGCASSISSAPPLEAVPATGGAVSSTGAASAVDADHGQETASTTAREKREFAEQHAEAAAPVVSGVYENYTPAKYQAALAAHEPIWLFFYAAWCPTCREQDPRTAAVFQTIKGVHGFRVNYDTETALKNQFHIYVQHTAISLNAQGREVKRVIGTQTNEQLQDGLEKLAAGTL